MPPNGFIGKRLHQPPLLRNPTAISRLPSWRSEFFKVPSIELCCGVLWERGIRTLSAERRQIYSLFQLSNSGALPGTEVILQVQNYSFVCEINLLYDFHMCALGWIRTNVRVTFLIPNLFVGKTRGGFRDASLTTSYFSLLHTKTLIFFLICIQSSICQCSLVYQTFI